MRYVIAAALLILVIGVLVAIKGAQFATLAEAGAEAERAGPPPEAVGTFQVRSQTWPITVEAVGSLTSLRGVSIRNEVPGIVRRLPIRSGTKVSRGEILVELDASVERAALDSALAAINLATTTVKRLAPLAAAGAASQAELDQAENELEASTARAAELRAQIARKVVRAPFSGRLGIRLVDLGQYLAAGTAITVLETDGAVLVDFAVPQQRLAEIEVGMPVRVEIGAASEPIEGAVAAVAPAVDAGTRTARLRASVDDERGELRRGMFVHVEVILGQRQLAVVPATALVRASYGDSVFVVAPGETGGRHTPDGRPIRSVSQRFVEIGPRRGDFVAILEGLEPGAEVVSAGAFKLRDGAPVVVTEVAVPTPVLAPSPPNR